jgi:hypothetical protein
MKTEDYQMERLLRRVKKESTKLMTSLTDEELLQIALEV